MAAETDPDRPGGRPVIEPTAIFRPGPDPESGEDLDEPVEDWMEDLCLFRPPGGPVPPEAHRFAEDETQEMDGRVPASCSWAAVGPPPEPAATPVPPVPPAAAIRRRPRTAVLIVAGVGLGVALALVLLLPGGAAINVASPGGGATASDRGGSPTASTAPTATAPAVPAPPGSQAGVLSQGDSGPQVSELQTRLLKIPDVYRDGRVNGTYDRSLAEAVARFQLWYGIRGDEDGVYGDATRRGLESRTGTVT
jgi:hypothetical protein